MTLLGDDGPLPTPQILQTERIGTKVSGRAQSESPVTKTRHLTAAISVFPADFPLKNVCGVFTKTIVGWTERDRRLLTFYNSDNRLYVIHQG